MDEDDLIERTPGLIDAFWSRIPERYRDSFDDELDGGEFGMAVEHLARIIVQCEIRVDVDERDELRQMLQFVRYSDVDIVNRFLIRPGPGGGDQ